MCFHKEMAATTGENQSTVSDNILMIFSCYSTCRSGTTSQCTTVFCPGELDHSHHQMHHVFLGLLEHQGSPMCSSACKGYGSMCVCALAVADLLQ